MNEDNKLSITADWLDGLAFEATVGQHKIIMDTVPEQDRALARRPSPDAGGSGRLHRHGCNFHPAEDESAGGKFRLVVEGDLTAEHPRQFYRIHTIYEFTGKNLDTEKLRRAIELSQDKYCGVSATIKKALPLTWEMKIIQS